MAAMTFSFRLLPAAMVSFFPFMKNVGVPLTPALCIASSVFLTNVAAYGEARHVSSFVLSRPAAPATSRAGSLLSGSAAFQALSLAVWNASS